MVLVNGGALATGHCSLRACPGACNSCNLVRKQTAMQCLFENFNDEYTSHTYPHTHTLRRPWLGTLLCIYFLEHTFCGQLRYFVRSIIESCMVAMQERINRILRCTDATIEVHATINHKLIRFNQKYVLISKNMLHPRRYGRLWCGNVPACRWQLQNIAKHSQCKSLSNW